MSKKVLIVEDEHMLSAAYAMMLTANGFEAVIANNGLEALQKLKTWQPDVILLDLLMPKMDGMTFLKTYLPDSTNSPRIIVFSNLFDSRKAHEVKALGAVDIILKSNITPEGLVELLESQFTDN